MPRRRRRLARRRLGALGVHTARGWLEVCVGANEWLEGSWRSRASTREFHMEASGQMTGQLHSAVDAGDAATCVVTLKTAPPPQGGCRRTAVGAGGGRSSRYPSPMGVAWDSTLPSGVPLHCDGRVEPPGSMNTCAFQGPASARGPQQVDVPAAPKRGLGT
mmetsp:Transcript_33405/g.87965  ORF Transcript_33405/g.87965 Transcript_33405/m.87965 type:complete len:161 (+) Transcript_33405:514-996(+)